jgi:hypothetical protein
MASSSRGDARDSNISRLKLKRLDATLQDLEETQSYRAVHRRSHIIARRSARAAAEADTPNAAVAGAALDSEPKVREAELGAGALDQFRCFSLLVLETAG